MEQGTRVRYSEKKLDSLTNQQARLRISNERGTILEPGEPFCFVEWDRYAQTEWALTEELESVECPRSNATSV